MGDIQDLIPAMATIAGISLICGLLACWRLYPQGDRLILSITVVLVGGLLFAWYGMGNLLWAYWIHSSSAIAWSNVAPLPIAICAGWMWRLPDRPVWRRVLLAGLLAMLATGALLWPVLGPSIRPPRTGSDEWLGNVALQTEWANCSPAAAATLLGAAGIPASEAEMVQLCLTDARGTSALGLYRGLKIKTAGTGRQLRILHSLVADPTEPSPLPAVLLVELPLQGVGDPRYERDWGWIPGMGHSVVCFGRATNGRWMIGDPSAGYELWTDTDLRVLWAGEGIAITP